MIRIAAASPDEVREILQPAAETNGRFALDEILKRGAAVKVEQNGSLVAAFVLETSGSDLWITAAAGKSDIDLTDLIAKYVIGNCRNAKSIIFRTTRLGLVKKAFTHGYECVMRKTL